MNHKTHVGDGGPQAYEVYYRMRIAAGWVEVKNVPWYKMSVIDWLNENLGSAVRVDEWDGETMGTWERWDSLTSSFLIRDASKAIMFKLALPAISG